MASKQDWDAEGDTRLESRRVLTDRTTFSELVDAYQARLYGFVLRMVRDERDAEDLTQEVFVRAYQGMASFDGRCSLRTWLFRIAHNLCVDRHRRFANRSFDRVATPEEEAAFELPDRRWDPERAVLDNELRTQIDRAVTDLSEKLRAVLLLHDLEGLGYQEIATALDIPVGTVKSRLFLARASLQRTIGEYLGKNPEACP